MNTRQSRAYLGSLYYLISTCIVTEGLILTTFDANKCHSYDNDDFDIGLSYQQCVQRCDNLDACVAVSFQNKMSVCKLHFKDDTISDCNGYVFARKTEWTQKINPHCSCVGIRSCVEPHTCTDVTCPDVPAPSNGRVLGKMKRKKDKIALLCDKGYVINGTRKRECLDGSWSGEVAHCEAETPCDEYLVGGPNGVDNSQLTQSNYYCNVVKGWDPICAADPSLTSAIYARLDATGHYTGGFVGPHSATTALYVQVDFLTPKQITAVVLQGRDPAGLGILQYVKMFKVITSYDCLNYTFITDENGEEMVFPGVTGANEKATVPLPHGVSARCVRISPQEWHAYASLRFDILGC